MEKASFVTGLRYCPVQYHRRVAANLAKPRFDSRRKSRGDGDVERHRAVNFRTFGRLGPDALVFAELFPGNVSLEVYWKRVDLSVIRFKKLTHIELTPIPELYVMPFDKVRPLPHQFLPLVLRLLKTDGEAICCF